MLARVRQLTALRFPRSPTWLMAIWAYLELFHGVNAFLRLPRLTYTISTALHLANALHHH